MLVKFLVVLILFMICNISCKDTPHDNYWSNVLLKNENIEIRLIGQLFYKPIFYLFSNGEKRSDCSRSCLLNLSGEVHFVLNNDSTISIKIWSEKPEKKFQEQTAMLYDTGEQKYSKFLGCILRLNNDASFELSNILPRIKDIKCSLNANILTYGDTVNIEFKDRLMQKGEWWGNIPGPQMIQK